MQNAPNRYSPVRSTAPPPGRFDFLTIFFHWTTVVLIASIIASAVAISHARNAKAIGFLLTIHRSLGATVWLTTVLRLLWRQTFAYFPPFPGHMHVIHRWVVTTSEKILYTLLVIQPLTGLGDTLLRGCQFSLFSFTIPAVLPAAPVVAGLFHTLHYGGAVILFCLIGAHAAAALLHHFVLRDDVLRAMLPWLRPAGRPLRDLRPTEKAVELR
jgi:cytochrome b561